MAVYSVLYGKDWFFIFIFKLAIWCWNCTKCTFSEFLVTDLDLFNFCCVSRLICSIFIFSSIFDFLCLPLRARPPLFCPDLLKLMFTILILGDALGLLNDICILPSGSCDVNWAILLCFVLIEAYDCKMRLHWDWSACCWTWSFITFSLKFATSIGILRTGFEPYIKVFIVFYYFGL